MTSTQEQCAKLGERIRLLRRRRGWSQKELASRSGLSMRFLGQLETGSANVSLGRLSDVAGALDVSVVTLVAGVGPVHDLADRVSARVWDVDEAEREGWEARLTPESAQKVALVGLRGAGKTTVGARSAEALGCRFVVVDAEVRDRSGLELADLFEMHGPAGYHLFCREVLNDVLAEEGLAVLEIGGSVPADPESWALLLRHTQVVWLYASAEAHLQRVAAQGDVRPMEGFGDAAKRLREILAAREPLYQRAHIAVDTEAEGIDGAVRRVMAAAQSVTSADAGMP